MPYTTVVSATTITASWGNANVRDQVVTPFASASARDSAITSPVTGMLCYTSGDDTLWRYNGSKWLRQRRCADLGSYSNSTTSFTDVGGISFTSDTNSTYAFDIWLSTVAPTAGDLQVQWVLPSAASIEWSVLSPASGNAGTTLDTTIFQGTLATVSGFTIGGMNSVGTTARATGTIVTAGTGGTCKVQAAQLAASGTSFIRQHSWFALEQTS